MNTRAIAEELRLTHWAGIMKERKESGLSVRAFCESAGFHENIYYYWQRKLREATCGELAKIQGSTNLTTPTFTEVIVQTKQLTPPAIPTAQAQVCVESAGVRITASCEYPADKLAVLLQTCLMSDGR